MVNNPISQTYFSNIILIKAVLIKSTLVGKYSDKIEVAMTMKSNNIIKANCFKFDLLIYIYIQFIIYLVTIKDNVCGKNV